MVPFARAATPHAVIRVLSDADSAHAATNAAGCRRPPPRWEGGQKPCVGRRVGAALRRQRRRRRSPRSGVARNAGRQQPPPPPPPRSRLGGDRRCGASCRTDPAGGTSGCSQTRSCGPAALSGLRHCFVKERRAPGPARVALGAAPLMSVPLGAPRRQVWSLYAATGRVSVGG